MKLFYSIGEVAGMLGESVSLIRFWTNYFSKFLNPSRGSRGNRLYKEEEIEVLRQIHLLVKEQGMTLEGAARKLGAESKSVSDRVKALGCLRNIREQLLEIKATL